MIGRLADGVAGQLGGKVGIAPRIFLKRLVGLIDRVDEHAEFDPKVHYRLTVDPKEMTLEEREAAGAGVSSVDDIALDLDGPTSGGLG